jgi:amino acid transporter/mannitol/fructose-specific phosphotransferase system IIA component (Ntr-type)
MLVPAVLSQLELATAIPKAGGTYFYSERILGSFAGVFAGLANWISIFLKSAFALVGIGVFINLIFPGVPETSIRFISAGACLFFGFLNIYSVKSSGKVQVFMLFFLLMILAFIVLIGWREVDFSYYSDITPFNWGKIFQTAGIVFISYGGVATIANIAEEVQKPEKSLVRGTLWAFGVVQMLYLLVVFVVIGVLPADKLLKSLTPVSDAALHSAPGTFGEVVFILSAVGAMLAFITTANGGIMTSSRVPMAMSRDDLIPSFFQKVSRKFKTPVWSIAVTVSVMLVIILTLRIDVLAKVASLFMILLFFMINLAVIIARQAPIAHYCPVFRAPFYPYTQIVGMGFCVFLILEMGTVPILITAGFLVFSVFWYFLYVRRRVQRKSALLHLVEEIMAVEFKNAESSLEKELLEILMERNEIEEDRFDRMVKDAVVLDLEEKMTCGEFFTIVARKAEEKWGVEKQEVEMGLETREEEASTRIYNGIAVPHAILHVPMKEDPVLVLARNRKGIRWKEGDEDVKAAFVLLGTPETRGPQLRALMAIAQILKESKFIKKWMNIEESKELRSFFLLDKRKRYSEEKGEKDGNH